MKGWIPASAGMTDRATLTEGARRRGLVQEPAALAFKERLEVIAKMISGLINGLDNRGT